MAQGAPGRGTNGNHLVLRARIDQVAVLYVSFRGGDLIPAIRDPKYEPRGADAIVPRPKSLLLRDGKALFTCQLTSYGTSHRLE